MLYLALILAVVISFVLGAVLVYARFNSKQTKIHNQYFRELQENYNLELQNKWLKESLQKLNLL
ncbi:MAG: hypothetical protein ACM3UR_14080 [Bacteroidota bacterium]|jgi:phosphatidylserine synthase|nr:hypothetical protein [Ignavibacteria bacterium]HEX2960176.1 hypothetical protein [Ignavibacteriales bacterium]MCU7498944.1 hypothetical protein [Ignavibacteria bacterium]MCU7513318.1 hypothetical protein [Ignavibacteria bacterium]MCU7521390.1 hypothetical protein [Ignavibacteria bacterium]